MKAAALGLPWWPALPDAGVRPPMGKLDPTIATQSSHVATKDPMVQPNIQFLKQKIDPHGAAKYSSDFSSKNSSPFDGLGKKKNIELFLGLLCVRLVCLRM